MTVARRIFSSNYPRPGLFLGDGFGFGTAVGNPLKLRLATLVAGF